MNIPPVQRTEFKDHPVLVYGDIAVRHLDISKLVSLGHIDVYGSGNREIHIYIRNIRSASDQLSRTEICRFKQMIADMDIESVHDLLIRKLIIPLNIDIGDPHRRVKHHRPYKYQESRQKKNSQHGLKAVRKIRKIFFFVFMRRRFTGKSRRRRFLNGRFSLFPGRFLFGLGIFFRDNNDTFVLRSVLRGVIGSILRRSGLDKCLFLYFRLGFR